MHLPLWMYVYERNVYRLKTIVSHSYLLSTSVSTSVCNRSTFISVSQCSSYTHARTRIHTHTLTLYHYNIYYTYYPLWIRVWSVKFIYIHFRMYEMHYEMRCDAIRDVKRDSNLGVKMRCHGDASWVKLWQKLFKIPLLQNCKNIFKMKTKKCKLPQQY